MKENLKKEFDKSLNLTRIAFLLSGNEIRIKEWGKGVGCSINTWLYYFNCIWMYIDVIGTVIWFIEGLQMGKSFDELSLSMPCAIICLIGTSKSAPLYFNRSKVKTVVEKMRDIHPEFDDLEVDNRDDEKEVEINIENETRAFLNKVTTLLFYAIGIVVFGFASMPIFSMLYDVWRTGSTDLKAPFRIKYFFNPTANYGVFLSVYFHQCYSTSMCALYIFSSDTFLYAICTYLKMHFRILCYHFENVVSDSEMKTREKFKKAVERHQALIQMVNQVQYLYSKSILLNIMISPVVICLSAFNIMFVNDTETLIIFVLFLGMNFFQTFLLCFFGDMLMTSSGQVCEAVYNCEWYNANKDIKKSVLIVMIRAQEPCKLTAMDFADLNLTTFTATMSRSWSCFALLKTMYG